MLVLLTIFRPRPFGYLHSKVNDTVDISLKALPRFPARLVRRSIIKTVDIRNYARSYKDFPFGAADFDIIFKRGGRAFIRLAKNNHVSIELLITDDLGMPIDPTRRRSRRSSVLNHTRLLKLKSGKLGELPFGSVIVVDGNPVASFEAQAGPVSRKLS